MEYMGMANASSTIHGEMCFEKIMIALAISVAMNSIFAPVFMTLHKITDTHIGHCGGSVKALLTPIPMKRIMTELNWAVLWGFVFKKTIPLFWYPAHTITWEFCWPLQPKRNKKVSESPNVFQAGLSLTFHIILISRLIFLRINKSKDL